MALTNRRKYSRKSYNVFMYIEYLYKQDKELIKDINAQVKITDISRGGLGFFSRKDLPINYYFNAHLIFDKNNHFKTVLKIIRKEKHGSGIFSYGCEFVGLADNISKIIENVL